MYTYIHIYTYVCSQSKKATKIYTAQMGLFELLWLPGLDSFDNKTADATPFKERQRERERDLVSP